MIYPFADFLDALREKDAGLFAKLCHLPAGHFWAEWKKHHPEDFPEGGMSRADRSSIVPKSH